MKYLNKQIVKEVAERLMTNFNQTTTLEIKMELRSQDYKANQKEVSDLIMELSDEYGWRWTNKINDNTGCIYRIYTLPDGYAPDYVNESDDIDTCGTLSIVGAFVSKNHKTRDGLLITDKSEDNTGYGDWLVSDINSSNVSYFDKIYTRDQVRGAHSKFYGVKFHDTRTSLVR